VFGIACLVSLATKRPLMFFVARSLATGGDTDRIAAWDARLVLPAFRKVMRRLTAVWGSQPVDVCCRCLAWGHGRESVEPEVWD
jgi:hypothetical protein